MASTLASLGYYDPTEKASVGSIYGPDNEQQKDATLPATTSYAQSASDYITGSTNPSIYTLPGGAVVGSSVPQVLPGGLTPAQEMAQASAPQVAQYAPAGHGAPGSGWSGMADLDAADFETLHQKLIGRFWDSLKRRGVYSNPDAPGTAWETRNLYPVT